MNICLVGDEKVEEFANQLKQNNPENKVETIKADFDQADLANYKSIAEKIDKIEDLSIVIMGSNVDQKGSFDCQSLEQIKS